MNNFWLHKRNHYHQNRLSQHDETSLVNNVKADSAIKPMRVQSEEERKARADRIRQFKASICN